MTPELSTADLSAAAQARRDEPIEETRNASMPDRRPVDEPGRAPEMSAKKPMDMPVNMPVNMNDAPVALFSEDQVKDLRGRWDQIQAGFVDEPRGAVEKADGLVADAITQLADGFARTRSELDHQWKRGDNVSTEDLRLALRRYRSFFSRLLEA